MPPELTCRGDTSINLSETPWPLFWQRQDSGRLPERLSSNDWRGGALAATSHVVRAPSLAMEHPVQLSIVVLSHYYSPKKTCLALLTRNLRLLWLMVRQMLLSTAGTGDFVYPAYFSIGELRSLYRNFSVSYFIAVLCPLEAFQN